jgi:hypothetical protein
VNFNFSTWGNPNCSAEQKTNDPTLLLPKTYTEAPIDTGLALDISVFERMAQGEFEASSINNPAHSRADNNSKNSSKPSINNSLAIKVKPTFSASESPITAASQKGETAMSASKKKVEANTTIDSATTMQRQDEITQRLQQIEDKFDTIEQILQSLKKDNQANDQTPDQATNNSISNDQAVSNSKISQPVSEQVSKQNVPQNIAAIVHNLVAQSAMPQSENHPKNQANKAPSLSHLNYPTQLTMQQCQSLQESLSKLDDQIQAQSLLDLFAQRLENIQNPVKNINAYFAKLVRRHQKGNLDLSSVQGEGIQTRQAKELAKQRHQQQVKYSQYHADYQHFEKVVQREMHRTGNSFAEACETTQMGIVLEDIDRKRSKAKQALEQL